MCIINYNVLIIIIVLIGLIILIVLIKSVSLKSTSWYQFKFIFFNLLIFLNLIIDLF